MPCSHLIDLNDLPVSEWSHIIDLAIKIKEHPGFTLTPVTGKSWRLCFMNLPPEPKCPSKPPCSGWEGKSLGLTIPKTPR